jgi:UPF0755 protein
VWDKLTQKKTEAITDYPGPGFGEISVTIEQGDLGSVIADKLVAAGVIATAGPFIQLFTQAGDQAASIQPGTYSLSKEMSSAQALGALMNPDKRLAITFTVPEGKRAAEVYSIVGLALAKAELDPKADQATIDTTTAEKAALVEAAAANLEGIGLPAEANRLVEGWFFPETYSFNLGTTPEAILKKMVATTISVLEELKVPRDRWLEVITMASMVEKESKLSPDRPKVARTFYNRLDKGMRLQSDATVVYGVKRFDGKTATSDADRANQNPFNTYVVPELPAGAICNPGREAISATLSPASGSWLYFVTVNPETGETEFNETAEGHDKSVAKWKAWEAAHSK